MAETPVSPMVHLIDESSPSDGDLVPRKRRIVDVGDRTTRVVDSSRDDHESTTAVLESDAIPPEMTLSVEVAEMSYLPEGGDGTRGPSEAADVVLVNESSSSRAVSGHSSAEDWAQGIIEDGYETDNRCRGIMRDNEGFTRVEIRLDGPSRTIAIPMDRDLLVDMKDVILSLGPICSNVEGRTLATINDSALSTGIVGLALRVSFLTFLVSMPCIFLFFFF